MSTRGGLQGAQRQKLPGGIYAICDQGVRPELSLVEKARCVLAGGVRVLQLRMKHATTREAVSVARSVVRLCSEAGALCLINDRVDWALLADAHGVHLGADDLAPEHARALLGSDRIIGVTVRNLEMCASAARAGADYVGLGPVFPTLTKAVPAPVLGVDRLAAFCAQSPLPVVAIGGIGTATVGDVARAGVHGAALASGLLLGPDIKSQAALLCAAFHAALSKHT